MLGFFRGCLHWLLGNGARSQKYAPAGAESPGKARAQARDIGTAEAQALASRSSPPPASTPGPDGPADSAAPSPSLKSSPARPAQPTPPTIERSNSAALHPLVEDASTPPTPLALATPPPASAHEPSAESSGRSALREITPFACADNSGSNSLITPGPAATRLRNNPMRRYMVDSGKVVGVNNTVARFHERKPVIVHTTPFNERVERELDIERKVLALPLTPPPPQQQQAVQQS